MCGSFRRCTAWSIEDAVELVRRRSRNIKNSELEVGQKIGEGAMAIVHKAKINGVACAAKMLRDGVAENTSQFQDLISEISILSNIGDHPNLVSFIGACMEDLTAPILVSELVLGPNLKDFLLSKQSGFDLGRPTVAQWTKDILSALNFLHDRDPIIMHRDIKPANMLLTFDLKSLKLTDFGLAKQLPTRERLQASHARCTGTLRYMAPEVYHHHHRSFQHDDGEDNDAAAVCDDPNSAVYTEKADVYSAALVIWYILTGFESAVNIAKNPARRPSLPAAEARWKDLAALIDRMWCPRAEERPPAGECLLYLDSIVHSSSSESLPSSNSPCQWIPLEYSNPPGNSSPPETRNSSPSETRNRSPPANFNLNSLEYSVNFNSPPGKSTTAAGKFSVSKTPENLNLNLKSPPGKSSESTAAAAAAGKFSVSKMVQFLRKQTQTASPCRESSKPALAGATALYIGSCK